MIYTYAAGISVYNILPKDSLTSFAGIAPPPPPPGDPILTEDDFNLLTETDEQLYT